MSESSAVIKLKSGEDLAVEIKYTTVRRYINTALDKAVEGEDTFVEVTEGDKRRYISVSAIAYVAEA